MGVYDLSQGFAAMMSEPLLGFRLDAIYHTAIVVYGKEYYYGGGISGSGVTELEQPGTTQLGAPMKRIKLGKTEIDQETFECWMQKWEVHNIEQINMNCLNIIATIFRKMLHSS